MDRPKRMPNSVWAFVTWGTHILIQLGIENAVGLLGFDPRWSALALIMWFGREVRDLKKKQREKGHRTPWDWADGVLDFLGPCLIAGRLFF